MKLLASGIQVNVRIINEHLTQTIVMLHGFTGSSMTWDETSKWLSNYRILTVDLVGHGKTDIPEDLYFYSMGKQVEILEEVFQQLKLTDFTLIGYSMGGRVALSYVAAFPQRVKHLILESSSPGLKTEEERAARRQADDVLAEKILQNGIASFVEQWENIPLFASQKRLSSSTQQKIKEERLSQSAIGLANSLRGMGTGSQKSLWSHLQQIQIRVTIITGELDKKFCKIGIEMENLLPNARYLSINDVGHAIHVENPKQFAKIVEYAIDNNIGQ